MALITIDYGALASSATMNSNFEYLDNRITSVGETITSNTAGIYSNIASINSLITATTTKIRPIGQPIIRLDNTIMEDEIRLEGGEVSRTTYSALFEIYGITYGSGDGVNTFNLPDFRNRVMWGGENFGYLDPTLPNIKGSIRPFSQNISGAFYSTGGAGSINTVGSWDTADVNFDASKCSSIYQDDATVRPASIKIRVVTRYQ